MSPAFRQALVIGAFAVLASVSATLAVSAATRPNVIIGQPTSNLAASTGTNNTYQGGIVTTGDATVSQRPDVAFISVGVQAQATTASAAQRDLASQAAKLIAKAKSLGIPDKEINTASYSIGPSYANDGMVIIGYRASEQLELKWHTVDSTGSALDALVQAGAATNVSVNFGLNDGKSVQSAARALAIADARARAQAMAKAAGVGLGQVLGISDYTAGLRTPVMDFAPSAAAAAPTQVPVGQLDITVQVQVSYAIS